MLFFFVICEFFIFYNIWGMNVIESDKKDLNLLVLMYCWEIKED